MSEPLAAVADLEAAWRSLTTSEQDRAEALLARASRKIRRRWPDVDARLTAGTLDPDDVADVVLEMVQSAMTTPLGVQQASENAGPFGHSEQYANPMGRLYFTDDMVAVFEGEPIRAANRWLA